MAPLNFLAKSIWRDFLAKSGLGLLAVGISLALLAPGNAADNFFGNKNPPGAHASEEADVIPGEAIDARLSEEDLLKLFGPLARDVVAVFSMDNPENGSVLFSRYPFKAKFSENVTFGLAGGRQCANFTVDRAALKLEPPLRMGPAYTFATWILLPAQGQSNAIWKADDGCLLYLENGNFNCGKKDESRIFSAYDKTLAGWHHLAVTCDGRRMLFYLDGERRGNQPWVMDSAIKSIGNNVKPEHQTSPGGVLDDMMVFGRDLTKEEITGLMRVRLPAVQTPPVTPVPVVTANTPAPAPSATPIKVGDLATAYRDSLVQMSGAKTSGVGFIARAGAGNCLVTNAHVATGVRAVGLKTLGGIAVNAGEPSIAVGHDIFRVELAPGGRPFEILPAVETNTAIGDDIAVLGTAEGGGRVAAIPGKLVGIGPDLVEVDAPFTVSNSGSPIVHLKTGRVIGVATYLTVKKYDDVTNQALKAPVIRRFGYRLDSVATWQPVNWTFFFMQATEMQNIESLTDGLSALLADLAKNHSVTPGLHTHPVIKTRIDAWMAKRNQRLSPQDATANDQDFISFLKVTSQADVTSEKRRVTYDYFQRALAEQQQARDEIAAVFDKIIKGMQKGS